MNKTPQWLLAAAAVMLLLPLLFCSFLPPKAGMAGMLLLYLLIEPLVTLFIGTFAGREMKKNWYLPPAAAVLSVLGSWLIFEMGEPAFLLYAGGCLVLGVIAMLVTFVLRNRKQTQ